MVSSPLVQADTSVALSHAVTAVSRLEIRG